MRDDGSRDVDQEERVARVLRRPLRESGVPAFAVIEARLQRRTPLPIVLSTGVAVVLLALIVGNALAERRGITPAATGAGSPTSVATPEASNPAVLSDSFGFVWVDEPAGLRVTPESGQGGFQLPARPYGYSVCSCAVSPDGTRIAYWVGSPPSKVELRVLDVARPAQPLTIYTAPENQRVSAVAWSSDGSGMLFSLEGVNPPGGPDRSPLSSALLVIEAGGGPARILDTDAGVYVPLGWDRRAGVAAAGQSGPGGYMRGYITVRTTGDPAPQRTAIADEILMLSVDVSTDQRFVLGVFVNQTGSTLRWWKLADFGAMANGPRIGDRVSPKWRPVSAEIGWIDGVDLQLLDVDRGVRIVGGSFPSGDHRLSAFRRDGTAVLVSTGGGPSPYVLLEIGSGRTAGVNSTGSVAGGVRFR